MNVHENCKGCTLYGRFCVFQIDNVAEYCPCLLCLTKKICDKQSCDLRSEHYYEGQAIGEILLRRKI